MRRFVVLEPPSGSADAATRTDAVFVHDGFSFWAFLFTFLWLFWHRLWLAGAATFVLVVGFFFLDALPGWSFAAALIELCLGVLVALEGPSLRIARLRRKGWRETAAFQAGDLGEAEILYYAGKVSAVDEAGPPDAGRNVAGRNDDRAPRATATLLRSAPWARSPGSPRPAARPGGFFDAPKAR